MLKEQHFRLWLVRKRFYHQGISEKTLSCLKNRLWL